MALDRTTPVYDPDVYGEPEYADVTWDVDVYGELTEAGNETNANAGAATGTGAAGAASADVAPNAGAASGSGTAFDATVSTGADTSVDAGHASGSGTAHSASASIETNAGAGTGAGAAGGPSSSVGVGPSTASGTGTAFDATVSTAGTSVTPTVAAGTGAAYNASVNVQPNAGTASGEGHAYWPVVFDPEVRIYIGGTDYAPSVLYSTARFLSQVNGVAGDCYIRLRDPDRTIDLPTGTPILLTIGGEPYWRGFISQWKRVYVFPAINIDAFGETRFFDIVGADINVLFAKRIVFNQADPEVVAGKLYPPFQADAPVVSDLVTDYLDLSSDTIDLSTFVDNVGDITNTQEGRAWSAGDTWGQAMQSIASLPAAIYYLRATLVGADLVYCDVDTPTAPYAMSDQPTGIDTVGYREMEILLDGSGLVNDQLVWGMGYGSQTPVFVREEDAASQAEHGLWQAGKVAYGVYKQGTIDRIANSIVYGSPSSKRGAKDDRVAVTLTTYTPGFLPSQKIDFTSEVWGFNDVLPVRKAEVTFELPDPVLALGAYGAPRFTLTLSHEIDTPFNTIDNYFLDLSFPPFPPLPPFPTFPGLGECTPAICGITDTFSRTIADFGWGTSDSGLTYNNAGIAGPQGVNGGIAYLGLLSNPTFIPFSTNNSVNLSLSRFAPVAPLDISFGTHVDPAFNGAEEDVVQVTAVFGSFFIGRNVAGVEDEDFWCVVTTADSFDGTFSGLGISINSRFEFRATCNAPGDPVSVYIWQGGSQPATPTATVDTLTSAPFSNFAMAVSKGDWTFAAYNAYLDDLDISGVDRCSFNFVDNFDNRTTTPAEGWATASGGLLWDESGPGGAQVYVEDGYGKLEQDGSVSESGQHTAFLPNETEAQLSMADFSIVAGFYIDSLPEFDGTNWKGAFWGIGAYDPANPSTFGRQAVAFIQRDPANSDVDSLSIITGTTPSTVRVSHAWVEGQAYNVRFEKEGSDLRTRVWDDGDPEPSSWDIEVTGVPVFNTARVIIGQTDNTRTLITQPLAILNIWWDYLNFDYTGKPCYVDGPVPVAASPPGPSGYLCEEADRQSSSVYTTTNAFVTGSSRVYINGLRQRRGGLLDYTEDPPNGEIVFTGPEFPEEDDVVRVCYYTAGPLG